MHEHIHENNMCHILIVLHNIQLSISLNMIHGLIFFMNLNPVLNLEIIIIYIF